MLNEHKQPSVYIYKHIYKQMHIYIQTCIYIYIYEQIYVYMCISYVDINLILLSEYIIKNTLKWIITDIAVNHCFKPKGNLAVNVSILLL